MKNSLIYTLSLLLLVTHLSVVGQDMQQGFLMLENGAFDEAKGFFGSVLESYPSNKTARICYGRALGLSGNADQALDIFNDLTTQYPNDQEVLLNKAEAHLWLKEANQAIETYLTILEKDSLSFNALLGFANGLSMSKQYKAANEAVEKALEVNPTNSQALISQKYIRLAYANKLASEEQRFDEALELVDLNLSRNADDQESLQLKANIHVMAGNYAQATQAFDGMKSHVDRLLGLSLAKHLEKKDVDALVYAKDALETDETRVKTHYISALLWNGELGKARVFADSLVAANPTTTEYVASQAEVAMYEADFINGYETYRQFLTKNPASFKGNLGIADASHALGIDDQAYKYVNNTLKHHPGQQDAKRFIQKLNDQHSPIASSSVSYGRSSDGSSFTGWSTGLESSLSPRISIAANYAAKTYRVKDNNATSSSRAFTLGTKSQVGKRIRIEAVITKIYLSLSERISTSRINGETMVSGRISKSQTVSLGYKSELQDFNSDLLNQNLKTSHWIAKNIMNWKKSGIGSYSEYYHSFFSDGNKRQLFFTSLYKVNEKKAFKVGVNYLTMAFEESISDKYFSPDSFHQFELFGDATLTHSDVPLALKLNGAAGYQLMDGQDQLSWRMKASLEKTTGRLKINVFGAYSSIVATQTNGFSFINCGATIKWQITKAPIFKID